MIKEPCTLIEQEYILVGNLKVWNTWSKETCFLQVYNFSFLSYHPKTNQIHLRQALGNSGIGSTCLALPNQQY